MEEVQEFKNSDFGDKRFKFQNLTNWNATTRKITSKYFTERIKEWIQQLNYS